MTDTTQIVLDTLSIIPADFNLAQEVRKAIDSALSTQFFQGGALLAFLGGLLMYGKTAVNWIWTRLNRLIKYSVYIDENSYDLYHVFADWFHTKHPTAFRNVSAHIDTHSDVKSIAERYYIKLFQHFDFNMIWYKRRLLFVDKARETLENSSSRTSRHLNYYTIYGFFAKGAIKSLLDELRQKYIDDELQRQTKSAQRIYYNLYSDWQQKELSRIKTFDNIFFSDKEDFVEDLAQFKKNRKIYNRLGISNKRGYLLSGPPGNGKSSIPLAMAKMLEMNIYYLNLASLSSDEQLTYFISDVKDNSIIVFEDVDVLLRKGSKEEATARAEGMSDKTYVTFSALLNVLNGVFEPDNCIIVMTTNHPERLDGALVRAGRVDKHLVISNPTLKTAYEFIDNFYQNTNNKSYTGNEYQVDLSIPMSEVQDYCLRHPNNPEAVYNLIKRRIVYDTGE